MPFTQQSHPLFLQSRLLLYRSTAARPHASRHSPDARSARQQSLRSRRGCAASTRLRLLPANAHADSRSRAVFQPTQEFAKGAVPGNPDGCCANRLSAALPHVRASLRRGAGLTPSANKRSLRFLRAGNRAESPLLLREEAASAAGAPTEPARW